MCLSRLGQIIYGALAFVTVALIAAAMFTKGWNQLSQQVNSTINGVRTGNTTVLNEPINFGLFFCRFPNPNATNTTIAATTVITASSTVVTASPSSTSSQMPPISNNGFLDVTAILAQSGQYCADWFNSSPTWQKVVIIAMCLALVVAVLAFLWNLFTFCACCCHGSITKPLPGLASLTCLLLVIGLVTFYWNNSINLYDFVNQVQSNSNRTGFDNIKATAEDIAAFLQNNTGVSYSFWLGCAAAVVALANAIVGALVVCLADKCV